MFYYDDFDPVNLMNKVIELDELNRQFAKVYNGQRENLNKYQMESLRLVELGYDLESQSYDLYAELGAVLEACERI